VGGFEIFTLILSGAPNSLQRRSKFNRPSGTQILFMANPGDKSPGYYRVSLRDEVKTGFQMPKFQGA
jgi:hypothetical protein